MMAVNMTTIPPPTPMDNYSSVLLSRKQIIMNHQKEHENIHTIETTKKQKNSVSFKENDFLEEIHFIPMSLYGDRHLLWNDATATNEDTREVLQRKLRNEISLLSETTNQHQNVKENNDSSPLESLENAYKDLGLLAAAGMTKDKKASYDARDYDKAQRSLNQWCCRNDDLAGSGSGRGLERFMVDERFSHCLDKESQTVTSAVLFAQQAIRRKKGSLNQQVCAVHKISTKFSRNARKLAIMMGTADAVAAEQEHK